MLKIINVIPQKGYRLRIVFENDTEKLCDKFESNIIMTSLHYIPPNFPQLFSPPCYADEEKTHSIHLREGQVCPIIANPFLVTNR